MPTTDKKPGAISKQERDERESAYRQYRDLGRKRTYDRLIIVLETSHGLLAKSKLQRWAKEDRWAERCKEYDDVHDITDDDLKDIVGDPSFDKVDRLMRFADIALQRALKAHIVPATVAEIKALVDAAANAIKLSETLRGGLGDKAKQEGGIKRIQEVLDAVEDRIRASFAGKQLEDKTGELIDVTPVAVDPVVVTNETVRIMAEDLEEPEPVMVEPAEPVVETSAPAEKRVGLTPAQRLAMLRAAPV